VNRLRAAAAVVVLALGGASAEAQVRSPRPGEAKREEVFRLVDAYVVSNLQDGLGLSDDQFVTVLPLVKKLQTERRDYLLGRARMLRELRRLMRAGNPPEPAIVRELGELKALESDGPARVKRSADALDAALSPVQQVKFRLLELEVEQRMRALLRRPGAARPGSMRSPG
jgi:hypothetical protein